MGEAARTAATHEYGGSPMSKLFVHENHPHQPQSVMVADVHEHIKSRDGLNTRIAIALTRAVGSMWTAYFFTVIALVGLLGLLGLLNPFTFLLATWFSQMFLQLVFLPILSVGQSVLGKHQEMVTEETAKNTRALLHQIMQVAKHLGAQDEQLLSIGAKSSEVKEVRIVQMNHESLLVEIRSDLDRLTQLVEAVDRRLQQLQKKASGA
jgi:hypothetical protein